MARADDMAVALDRLLASERAALLSGKVDDLDRLARRKADLVARIVAEPDSEAALSRMKAALLRQDRLIAAVRAGRQVAQTANRDRPQLRTYGPDGASDLGADQGRRFARRL
jgi:flagellar biosynthesis/type III secretory pathway chaperone